MSDAMQNRPSPRKQVVEFMIHSSAVQVALYLRCNVRMAHAAQCFVLGSLVRSHRVESGIPLGDLDARLRTFHGQLSAYIKERLASL